MALFGINTFNLKNVITRKIKKDSFIWWILGLFQGVSFYINYLFYYKLKFLTRRNSIHEIHLEFVSYCNLRCQLCSLDHDKPKIRMSPSLLKHFFDDFLSDNRFRNVTTIHLYNAGEVLLHPELETMLAIIRDYKDKAASAKIPFPEIGLLTNATILNEKNSKILINANVLNHIRFSMDGGTREKFEEMRSRATGMCL